MWARANMSTTTKIVFVFIWGVGGHVLYPRTCQGSTDARERESVLYLLTPRGRQIRANR
jgi:hypothetical protein